MNTVSGQPLFDPVEAFEHGSLAVPGGHRLALWQSGNPRGRPLLLLHGGPGSCASPMQRRFFDPALFRIVQFDQRGCGASEPAGETRHNHTAALLADIERIRGHLGIECWLVSGGSWGATLAAVYAAAHRARVEGLLLRALFLAGRADLAWFFGAAGALLPQAWQVFLQLAPRSRRRRFTSWLWQVFERDDEALQRRVAGGWQAWEVALQGGVAAGGAVDEAVLRRYRLQAHYLARQCFLGEAAVLGAISRLHGLPVLMLHGRRDLVCRPVNSWRAWRSLTGSRLQWIDEAGHDPFAPAMASAMVAAAGCFAASGDFDGLGEVSAADRPAPRSRC